MTRQSGYYWIKELKTSSWVVARYHGSTINRWSYSGNPLRPWRDSEFYQINETRILAPDEVSDE